MHMTWVMAEWWLVFVKIEQFMSRICRDVFCLRILSDAVWPCPASWLSQTRQWLMYTGQTGWLQCRRWPSAPVAGGTSWIAAGNTTSAGPCSRQTDVRTTSNPWSTSDTLLFRMVRRDEGVGGSPTIQYRHNLEQVQLQVVLTAISCLYADSSLVIVLDQTNEHQTSVPPSTKFVAEYSQWFFWAVSLPSA